MDRLVQWLLLGIIAGTASSAFGQADEKPAGEKPAGEKQVAAEAAPPAEAKAAAAPAAETPPVEAPVPESQTQKWEFGISVRAAGGPCGGIFATFPVPADWPEQDVKVVVEQVTPHVKRMNYRENDGLKQVVFEIPQLAPNDTATCFLTLDVTRRAQRPPANTGSLIVPKDIPRDIRKYLGPSPLIESTNLKFRALAKELTTDKDTAWEQVQALVSGVREKVTYEQDPKKSYKGAIGAIRDGKADREDMTAAFVALCRASKIPARMVWAMDYCYAEFYLEEDEADDKAGDSATDRKADAARPIEKAKDRKAAKAAKGPQGAWYPCVVHEQVELGVVNNFNPILEKGDNFKIPEEKAPQRIVKDFFTGKGISGGKPVVEFRKRRAD
jgi:transglutaminase-like putative cysteine protease